LTWDRKGQDCKKIEITVDATERVIGKFMMMREESAIDNDKRSAKGKFMMTRESRETENDDNER